VIGRRADGEATSDAWVKWGSLQWCGGGRTKDGPHLGGRMNERMMKDEGKEGRKEGRRKEGRKEEG